MNACHTKPSTSGRSTHFSVPSSSMRHSWTRSATSEKSAKLTPVLVAGVGYVGHALGADTVGEVQRQIQTYAREVFASDSIVNTVTTSIDDVLDRGRLDLLSLAFALSLWSGSRVLNVFIDTI